METPLLFSYTSRIESLENAVKSAPDLLIVGGGITGAGIAVEAVNRGLTVLLIEKSDFGSGTSSKSTKLIHGGLRYLKTLQFRFVKQLVKEREIIYNNTRHLVIPSPVLLPIYKGGQLKKSLTHIALFLYDSFGVKKEHKFKWVNKEKLLNKYPNIKSEGLKGGFIYFEYRTNDSRLVIENIKTAVTLGAKCINYCNPKQLLYDKGIIQGAILVDELNKKEYTVRAKQVINATGPWTENFALSYDMALPKRLVHTKGVHIVLEREQLPLNEALYLEHNDKRMIFAIPRNNRVYIGTTDTPHANYLDEVIIKKEDVDYLLDVLNAYFPNSTFKTENILGCWASLRPLIEQTKSGEISRRDEIYYSKSKLLTITGGKLTGYRLMANKTVNKAIKENHLVADKSDTSNLRLSGSNWKNPPNLNELVNYADSLFDEAKQTGISVFHFKQLFYRYGTNTSILTEKAYELYPEFKNKEKLWLWVELWYTINYEMVCTLSDFFIRRTEMAIFEPELVDVLLSSTTDYMAKMLQWSKEEKQEQLKTFIKQRETYHCSN